MNGLSNEPGVLDNRCAGISQYGELFLGRSLPAGNEGAAPQATDEELSDRVARMMWYPDYPELEPA